MPQEKLLDALGLDAFTGFSEETWAEFLLGLAQHSGEINRFFGRHTEAHWKTLTIGQVKEWYEYRRRQQHALEAPQPAAPFKGTSPMCDAKAILANSFQAVAKKDLPELLAKFPFLANMAYYYCPNCEDLQPGQPEKCEKCGHDLTDEPAYFVRGMDLSTKGLGQSRSTRARG